MDQAASPVTRVLKQILRRKMQKVLKETLKDAMVILNASTNMKSFAKYKIDEKILTKFQHIIYFK